MKEVFEVTTEDCTATKFRSTTFFFNPVQKGHQQHEEPADHVMQKPEQLRMLEITIREQAPKPYCDQILDSFQMKQAPTACRYHFGANLNVWNGARDITLLLKRLVVEKYWQLFGSPSMPVQLHGFS